MKTIQAVIELASDGTYCVYCANEIFSGMGASLDEAKDDLDNQITAYLAFCKEQGKSYPKWLNADYTIQYKFDTQSLLEYYWGVLTPAALERLTGINQKQIWNYAHGKSKPRKPQLEKLQNGLRKFAQELSTISLV